MQKNLKKGKQTNNLIKITDLPSAKIKCCLIVNQKII